MPDVIEIDATTGEATPRDFTDDEAAQRAADIAEAQRRAAEWASRDGNRATIEEQATAALAANRTYVALTSPTAAQTTAQVKALTRQNNAIIRLLLGLLDGTD